MATSDYSTTNSPALDTSHLAIGPFTMARLGLFNLGLGLMAVLTLAVLNRVMISELGIPGTVTAGVLAVSQLVAPARVWFGQLSDAKPIFGLHRSGYVWIGTALFGMAVFVTVQIVWQMGAVVRATGGWVWNGQTIGLTGLLAVVLAFYGLALSASSTPFTAMLVDISEEKSRSKIVAVVWSMLMVGIVVGGITGSIVLKKVQQTGAVLGSNVGAQLLTGDIPLKTPLEVLQGPINRIFLVVPAIVLGLALISTLGIEKKYSRFASRSQAQNREDSMTLGTALKILLASRQTGIFFSYLLLMVIGLFMQEAILEPYGGEVFGMSIAQTTLLNAFWGIGILIGYGFTGFLVVPRLGKQNTARVGCYMVAFTFLLIILAGFSQNPQLLKLAMVLFGIAAGVTTIGSISLMLDLTAAETAGTFIGAWGLAQALSRAFATLMGGVFLDVGKALFSSSAFAYYLVFALQSVFMLSAITILNRVSVREFKENTQQAIATIMEGDLEG